MKALGALFDAGVNLRDIAIENDMHGKPFVTLPERLQPALERHKMHISISHSQTTASAVAILERLE